MSAWFETMEHGFWLHPDKVGRKEAEFILKALHLRRGDAVLDAPCGAGRVSFHLARAGCVVTGFDLRSAFIRRARRRFNAAGLRGTFRVLDLRFLDVEERFHGILNWAGSFGYFSEAGNAQLVAAYARALRPGGFLIVEQADREHILRHLRPAVRAGTVVYRSRWDRRKQQMMTRWIVDGVDERRNCSVMRLYTPAQMCALFGRCGLAIERMHKAVRFDAFGPSAPRMVIVGRKSSKAVK